MPTVTSQLLSIDGFAKKQNVTQRRNERKEKRYNIKLLTLRALRLGVRKGLFASLSWLIVAY